ncbi:hypothetical protein H8356DRAFT_1350340 [Neocallimastix lanati (nom. inval.)]|nr:hypothetical protein H8356DRAFT_1350340 [Neocallimastix sp. JGI-2020a]
MLAGHDPTILYLNKMKNKYINGFINNNNFFIPIYICILKLLLTCFIIHSRTTTLYAILREEIKGFILFAKSDTLVTSYQQKLLYTSIQESFTKHSQSPVIINLKTSIIAKLEKALHLTI